MERMRETIEKFDAVPLTRKQVEWLTLLTSEWQVLADLASADLVLWLRTKDERFVSVALCRSATASTVHLDDTIGLRASRGRNELLERALETCSMVEKTRVQWAGLYSVEISCVPVSDGDGCFAVMSMDANVAAPSRHPGNQWWTSTAAEAICHMISHGEFPFPDGALTTGRGSPRVLDGTILVNDRGYVMEISPNANSAMRRLGLSESLIGRHLRDELRPLGVEDDRANEALSVIALGRAPWETDIEANGHTIVLRAVPLLHHGKPLGAVLLTRDVTESRKHHKKLMTKDATIREIHHRVKNNLQTVSALLRIQERRSQSVDVKKALQEAGRRVETVAAVHEALSHNVHGMVDFDEVAQNILDMAVRVATAGPDVKTQLEGRFGPLSADRASALATILVELAANSVEHGYRHGGGTVLVKASRESDLLTVIVEDAGVGMAGGEPLDGLGLQIVRLMVAGELDGTIEWSDREGGGTTVTIKFRPCTSGAPEEES